MVWMVKSGPSWLQPKPTIRWSFESNSTDVSIPTLFIACEKEKRRNVDILSMTNLLVLNQILSSSHFDEISLRLLFFCHNLRESYALISGKELFEIASLAVFKLQRSGGSQRTIK